VMSTFAHVVWFAISTVEKLDGLFILSRYLVLYKMYE